MMNLFRYERVNGFESGETWKGAGRRTADSKWRNQKSSGLQARIRNLLEFRPKRVYSYNRLVFLQQRKKVWNGWQTRRKVLRGRITMEFYASTLQTVMVFALRSELFMIVQGKSQGLLLRQRQGVGKSLENVGTKLFIVFSFESNISLLVKSC